jgi:hypothetical protein
MWGTRSFILIIHEIAEEIQDQSFLSFVKLQLPKFYPHDLTTIKIKKGIVDMSDEKKQSLLICIEHSQKIGNKLIAIRNSSLRLIFFVPNEDACMSLRNAFMHLEWLLLHHTSKKLARMTKIRRFYNSTSGGRLDPASRTNDDVRKLVSSI